MQFSTIHAIVVEDTTTWQDQVFVTVDVDWASDFVLEAAIQRIEQAIFQSLDLLNTIPLY